jgi:hypothetical protein
LEEPAAPPEPAEDREARDTDDFDDPYFHRISLSRKDSSST